MGVVNQKRIAVNTLLLYVRMGLVLVIGLYTTRVVLGALGKTDYGLYGVVGSLVVLFSFLSNSMSTACQRFFSFELGRGDVDELRARFTQCMLTFVLIATVMVLMFETAGLWYVRNVMDCGGRDRAVGILFQLTVIGVVFQVLRTPYMGIIIAREQLSVFAVLNIFEAVATLVAAVLLKASVSDRLVFYATMMMIVQAVTALAYYLYCRICNKECRLSGNVSRKSMYEVFKFTGWEMVGTLAGACKFQGVNLLLNPLFGNITVAARTVSQKVYMSVVKLQDDFFKATRPQIIKSYAAGDVDGMLKLICQSTRFSFYLMLMVSLPIMLETPFILDVWLREKDVPEMSVLFTRLILVNGLVDVFSNPFASAIQATGKNKWYQICMGVTLFAILPISYIGMSFLGWPAVSVFYVSILLSALAQCVRLYFVKKQVGIDVPAFLRDVLAVILVTVLLSLLLPLGLQFLFGADRTVIQSLAVIAASFVWTGAVAYFVGATSTERKHINEFIYKLYNRVLCRQ